MASHRLQIHQIQQKKKAIRSKFAKSYQPPNPKEAACFVYGDFGDENHKETVPPGVWAHMNLSIARRDLHRRQQDLVQQQNEEKFARMKQNSKALSVTRRHGFPK